MLTGYLFVNHFNSKLNRVDAFSAITGGRPPVLVKGAQNILLLGSDSRDPSEAADIGGWRTDTIILMHIDGRPREGVPDLDPTRHLGLRAEEPVEAVAR